MQYYYWSDTHFNHRNIIKYSQRPFTSPEEMNAAMLAGTTSVPRGATIVHGGDFSLGGAMATRLSMRDYLLASEGREHMLCLGNHDHEDRLRDGGFAHSIAQSFEINDNGARVLIIHDPADIVDRVTLATKNGPLVDNPEGVIVLYGHTHAIAADVPSNWYHMGVDTIGFAPQPLNEIVRINLKERYGPESVN